VSAPQPGRRTVLAALAGGAAALGLAACTGDDRSGSGGSGASAGGSGSTSTVRPLAAPPLPGVSADPFTLGVASGDPDGSSVVLWTRLAPVPDRGDGGMAGADARVVWEVAEDDAFRRLVATGTAVTTADHGHSVHAVADGLTPDRRYHYRFRAGTWTSPTGRTRTAPRADDDGVSRLVLASASCQDYEAGYYVAHRALAAEADLDLVLWLGDYIYEGGPTDGGVRRHSSAEVTTLDGYRRRYALYTGDADLQAARAAAPWIVIWDDHEVENNYAGLTPEKPAEAAAFPARRAAAYQAWWENQPTRLDPPTNGKLPGYRDLRWGTLAHLYSLDTRQDRSDQVCSLFPGVDVGPVCAALDDPDQLMVGRDQEEWLVDQIGQGGTHWNVVANQVVMTPVPVIGEDLPADAVAAAARSAGIASLPPLDGLRGVLADQWDGYPKQRQRILDAMAAATAPTIVLTGDIHASAAGPLHASATDPASKVVGAELVGTSVSSDNGPLGSLLDAVYRPAFEYYQSDRRGYLRCEITPVATTATYVVVADARDPRSTTSVDATFRVEPDRAFTRV
jgi:alkaline phosphatase D